MQFKWLLMTLGTCLFVSACAGATNSNGLATGTVITSNTNPAIPALSSENSTIDCSGWASGAKTFIRQQGHITINKTIYGVATFACGQPDSEFGNEFVESFVFDKGIWAANGLVAGTNEKFVTTSACVSGTEIICPAANTQNGPDDLTYGKLVIFEKDGGLAWRYEPNK